METLFRWIHLSDIHVGHGDKEHGWDQKLVMDVLRKDVAQQVEKGHAPVDAILVTGDIAFSGGKSPAEYPEARMFFEEIARAAGVTKRRGEQNLPDLARVFLVPGNHDVDRSKDGDRDTKRLVTSLRKGEDKLDSALDHGGDRGKLAARMAAYLELAKDFAPFCSRLTGAPEDRLWWVNSIEAREGLRVRLVGLNTSLLASGDDDQGKLRLGKRQLSDALLRDGLGGDGELVMVLSHHPLTGGWLADQGEADGWIRNHTHVHLSGHVHDASSEEARSGAGGSFLRVVAGSAHGERLPPGVPASHGYSFGAVVRDGGRLALRIWPRKWSPRNASFRVDSDNVPDGETCADHDLAVRLAPPHPLTPSAPMPAIPRAKSGPAATPVAEGRPAASSSSSLSSSEGRKIEVFISFAPEDDAYRHQVEKCLRLLGRRLPVASFSAAQIVAGEPVTETMRARLLAAELILVLVSADYLSDPGCLEELDVIMDRHRAHVSVLPVLVRACDYSHSPIAAVSPIVPRPPMVQPARGSSRSPVASTLTSQLSDDARVQPLSVAQYPDEDLAYLSIQQEIARIVTRLVAARGPGATPR
jgi:Calcineurin-like phosphoesterase/TIR domain